MAVRKLIIKEFKTCINDLLKLHKFWVKRFTLISLSGNQNNVILLMGSWFSIHIRHTYKRDS